MNPRVFADVDPRTLRLPLTRQDGADPFKFALQTARYGLSIAGMPTILVARGPTANWSLSMGSRGQCE